MKVFHAVVTAEPFDHLIQHLQRNRAQSIMLILRLHWLLAPLALSLNGLDHRVLLHLGDLLQKFFVVVIVESLLNVRHLLPHQNIVTRQNSNAGFEGKLRGLVSSSE